MLWATDEIPRPLWHARPSAPREADAVVVGGGICGLSTAYWLVRELGDGARVVLLEAGALAGRASGRNAGFLLVGTPEPFTALCERLGREPALALWQRTRENRALLREELLDGGASGGGAVDADFLPEGSWIAALDDVQEEALEASCAELRGEGFECEWRDAAAVRQASGADGLRGAMVQPLDGGLDPVKLCRGMAAVGGFEVRTGARVRGIGQHGDRVHLTTDAGEWLAPRAVLALNAHAPTLLPHLAPEIRPVRAQMLATEPGERRLPGVWYLDDGYEYLRQLADGTVLLGGARQTAVHEETGYLESPTARVQGALDGFLARRFPHLAGRPVRHRWAGIMALTADGLPRLGAVPGVPGALYAAGFNGHGMSLGFVTGRHLARRAAGREVGELVPGALPG